MFKPTEHPYTLHWFELGQEGDLLMMTEAQRLADISILTTRHHFHLLPPDMLTEWEAYWTWLDSLVCSCEDHMPANPRVPVPKLATRVANQTIYAALADAQITNTFGRMHASEFLASLEIPPMDPAVPYLRNSAFR